MLEVSPNPFAEPIKKLFSEFNQTKWKFPYILQTIYTLLSAVLLLILLILYVSVGFISQVSNSFWDVLSGLGQKMSFSNPFPSLFYAISAIIYFVLFLPFFILQFPFWTCGWLTSKIGFKPLLAILIIAVLTYSIYHFQPEFARGTLNRISDFQESIKSEYFSQDSVVTQDSVLTDLSLPNTK